jgi:hypothetical protein
MSTPASSIMQASTVRSFFFQDTHPRLAAVQAPGAVRFAGSRIADRDERIAVRG